jgi:hypothetical protein
MRELCLKINQICPLKKFRPASSANGDVQLTIDVASQNDVKCDIQCDVKCDVECDVKCDVQCDAANDAETSKKLQVTMSSNVFTTVI